MRSRTPMGLAARALAAVQEPLDRQLSPLGLRAMAALAPQPGERILDFGCGAGQTVLQLVEHVGPTGRVVGVDIAPALLRIARKRALGMKNARFMCGDAQKAQVLSNSFDGVFSRFGVMTFKDPVDAFTNFLRALRPSGRMAFVCWRSLHENELDLLPLRAAGLEHAANAAPFSFANPDRIRSVLSSAGFERIAIDPHDEEVGCGDLEDMVFVALSVGPLGRVLRETPVLRGAAEPKVRSALISRGGGRDVSLRAATWIVSARRPGPSEESGSAQPDHEISPIAHRLSSL